MNHHAYFVVGGEEGLEAAYRFAQSVGLERGDQDIIVLQPALFSTEEARKLAELASRTPAKGSVKVVIAYAQRIFPDAQNMLLKTFEEPPEGTYLIIIVPSEGTLIPTLRSRLLPLPSEAVIPEAAKAFWEGTPATRSKVVEELLDAAKSDKEDEKRLARTQARVFVEGLVRLAYERKGEPAVRAYLEDLSRFVPILHGSSAPLKMILEHVLITAPKR